MKRFPLTLLLPLLLLSCHPEEIIMETNEPEVIPLLGIEPDLYLHVGDRDRLTLAFEGQHPTWSIDKPEVASVDQSGNLVAKSIGEAVVTVKYDKVSPVQSHIHVVGSEVLTFRTVHLPIVFVEGGTYLKGQEGDDLNPAGEATAPSFRIAAFKVTGDLLTAIGMDPAGRAAAILTYEECLPVLERLGQVIGKTCRFPSDVEWEWAARGGLLSKGYRYAGSDNPDDLDGGYFQSFFHVAQAKPNELELYDMGYGPAEWIAEDLLAGEPGGLSYEPWRRYRPLSGLLEKGSLRIVIEP